MKHLRAYESIGSPPVGDYVYVRFTEPVADSTREVVENCNYIGVVHSYINRKSTFSSDYVVVLFEYLDKEYRLGFSEEEIMFSAKTMKELLMKIDTNKFNL